MKITLIHGDDPVAARQRFTTILEAIKQRGWDVVSLNSNTNLRDQLSANSLFSENILFIIESGVDKTSPEDFKWLSTNYPDMDVNLLIYHKGQLGKLIINKFPKSIKIESFDLPKELFTFLDMVYPGNLVTTLKVFHRLIKSQAAELVFTMLSRHLKDLYWVSVDPESTGYPSWRLGKLKSQANKFGSEKIKTLINSMAELDIKTKTSQTNLVESLDFLFVTNLQ